MEGLSIAACPDTNQTMTNCDMKQLLTLWKLPEEIIEFYHQKGIDNFFEWQVKCLNLAGVLEFKRNLVYSAPTSAGKTLVSDVLLYRTVLQRKKKAIVILPYIAIAEEKVQLMKQLFRRIGVKIDSFAGRSNSYGGLDRVDVAVCTIEKANNMINRLIEEKRLFEIGLIVVDELHLLGDSSRGFLLELLLTKVLYANKYDNSTDSNGECASNSVQIVAMSATIGNLSSDNDSKSAIAQWLDAQVFESNFRPVPLTQKIIRDNSVFRLNEDLNILEPNNKIELKNWDIKQLPGQPKGDEPLIISSIETFIDGYAALIFCESRQACEVTSHSIVKNIQSNVDGEKNAFNSRKLSERIEKDKAPELQNKIQTLISCLRQTSFYIDKTLEVVLPFGVAFHHAGLSLEERSLIENAFRDGTIRILCSTTTLSTGVNLPARRVLIRLPWYFKGASEFANNYRHMIGRAGRKGIDQCGESMLFCKRTDFRDVNLLVRIKLPPIKSSFFSSEHYQSKSDLAAKINISSNLIRAILEVISNGTATCISDLSRYIQCTFFYICNDIDKSDSPYSKSNLSTTIEQVCDYLKDDQMQLINEDKEQNKLTITQLGKAIVVSGVVPDMGQFIYDELNKARRSLSLVNDLHLVYLVTPTYVVEKSEIDKIDWHLYHLRIWSKLSEDDKTVAGLVGIKEQYLVKRMQSTDSSQPTPLEHKRFYASLALNDLVQEMPLLKVATKYRLSKGLIQSLQQQSASFAGMLTTFCTKLGWHSMKLNIEQFQTRLFFGIQPDLIDLMRISFLNSSLARQLFVKGFDSLLSILNCKTANIEEALIYTSSFEKQIDRNAMKVYIPKLNKNVTIKKLSEMISKEARLIVENEVGRKFAFDEDTNDNMMLFEQITSNRPNLKRFRSFDSSIEDLIPNKLAKQNDHSVVETDKQDFSPYMKTFGEHQLEKCVLPSSFDQKITAKIPMDKYELVEVKTELQCQQLLEEIFSEDDLYSQPDAVLDIAVHFRLLSADANEQGLLIEKPYSMVLSELNLARLGHSRVFQIKSIDMFKCLQQNLNPCLSKMNSSFELFENNESSPDKSSKRRFRFFTYDIKKSLFLFQFGFHLPIDALVHQIDWHDLSVAIWLLDPEANLFNINKLSMQNLMQITRQFNLYQNFFHRTQIATLDQDAPKDGLLKTAILFHLMGQFGLKLWSDSLYSAYKLIELPARICMYSLQTHGIRIDQRRLKEEHIRLPRLMDKLEKDIFELTGNEFNLENVREVAEMLYDKLKLISYFDVEKSNQVSKPQMSIWAQRMLKTRSTNKLILMILQDACGTRSNFPTLIVNWRKLNHAFYNVVLPIRKALSFDQCDQPNDFGDRLAIVYGQCQEWTATGRISMHEPNLINVNNDFKVTEIIQSGITDNYEQNDNMHVPTHETIQLRKMIRSRDQYVLVSGDYCQLELRILAHFTRDPVLLAALDDSSNDVFKSIAAKWKGMDIKDVTYEMRQQAKQICYGIIYGMENETLASKLEVSEDEAAQYRKSFFMLYTQIEPFINDVIQKCTTNSYVETICQRRRFIPNISSRDQFIRRTGERQAVNTMIQGSAADIVKLSMIAVEKGINKSKPKLDASLVMQMYDELMYEVKDDQVTEFSEFLKDQMEKISRHLNVTLPVKVRSGLNWGSLQEKK